MKIQILRWANKGHPIFIAASYPIIFIGFYFFIFVLLVSGCSFIKKDNDEIKITDLPPIKYEEPVVDKINIVSCIKMLPECNA